MRPVHDADVDICVYTNSLPDLISTMQNISIRYGGRGGLTGIRYMHTPAHMHICVWKRSSFHTLIPGSRGNEIKVPHMYNVVPAAESKLSQLGGLPAY